MKIFSKLKNISETNVSKNLFLGSGITFLTKSITLPIGIIIAKVIGAEGYGFYGIATVVAQFLSYGNLGIFNGLNRELPISKGFKDRSLQKDIYNAVFTFLIISSFLISIFFLCYFFLFGEILKITELSIIIFIILIFLTSNLESFFYNSFKGENQLKVWSVYVSIRPLVDSLFSLFLVFIFGYKGFIFSIVLSKIISSVILRNFYLGTLPKFIINRNICNLLRTGLPIMLGNLSKNILVKSPILFSSSFLPIKEVGYLVFAISNMSIDEKLPVGHIFALSHRNNFAKSFNKEPISKKHINYFIESENLKNHIFFNSIVAGLLAILYFLIIEIFLNDFKEALFLFKYICTFYLLTSISFFLMQILDILKYLYTKIFIILSGVLFFLINFFICENPGLQEIIQLYLFSSILIFVLINLYLFFSTYSLKLLKSFLQCSIYIMAFFYFLNFSLYFSIFDLPGFQKPIISSIIDTFLSAILFSLLITSSFLILYFNHGKNIFLNFIGKVSSKR